MNIVQIHERTRFWLDSVKSARFESTDIDNGLNTAIGKFILDTYGPTPGDHGIESFQRTQRCRDSLGPVVKRATKDTTGFSINNANKKLIDIDKTSGYNLLLSLSVKIGSKYYSCDPLTYDIKNTIDKNPFRKIRVTPTPVLYYNEIGTSIEITHAFTDDITDFEIIYISQPTLVNYGIEYTSSKNFVVDDIVYAVEPTVYNGVTYKIGDEIKIVTGHLAITSGIVVFNYVDCTLRPFTHEEIAFNGAINCLVMVGNDEKAKMLIESKKV